MSSSLGLDLKADDFTLFGVPRAFEQDPAELARRWRELQGAVPVSYTHLTLPTKA